MSEPTPPAVPERKCEGCGTHTTAYKKIHLTNGALVLCEQCLSDINRKNPALVHAEAALAALRAELADLQGAAKVALELAHVAETERDAALAEVEGLRRGLESIRVRCREGDKRSDWLPVIDDIARQLLERLKRPSP